MFVVLCTWVIAAASVSAGHIHGKRLRGREPIAHGRTDYRPSKRLQNSNEPVVKPDKKSYMSSYDSPSPYQNSYPSSYPSSSVSAYLYPSPPPPVYAPPVVNDPGNTMYSSYPGYPTQGAQIHCSSYPAGMPATNRNEKFEIKGKFFKSIGCWSDNSVRAIESLEGKHVMLKDLDYRSRVNALMKCAAAALNKTLNMFALQNGGQCFGGKNAEGSFRKYGPSTACCGDGEGGPWSNEVYSFLDNSGKPFVNASYKPWSSWSPCSQTCNSGTNNPVQVRNRTCFTIQLPYVLPMPGCSPATAVQTRPCVLQICSGGANTTSPQNPPGSTRPPPSQPPSNTKGPTVQPQTQPPVAPQPPTKGPTVQPQTRPPVAPQPPTKGPTVPPTAQPPVVPQPPGLAPPTSLPSTIATPTTIGPQGFGSTATTPQSPVCKAKVDLGFLIDGSGSIEQAGKGNFKKELNFVKAIVSGFEVSKDETHVGVIIFSSSARVVSGFDEHYDKSSILAAISGIKYPGYGTKIGMALDLARNRLYGKSARQGIKNILIVLTDGASKDSITEPAQRLRDSGVTIFSVGIGRGYNTQQLNEMATDPDSQHVYKADFNNLGAVIKSIKDRACLGSGGATQAPPTGATPQGQVPQVCKAKVDLVILIDGSQSIEYFAKGNFQRCLNFVKQLLGGFNIAKDGTHVGIVVFSNKAEVVFGLQTYLSLQPILQAIDSIKYPQSSTYTGAALDVVRTKVFETSARQGVPDILLVMTDGAAQDDVEEPSKKLRDMGVTVFSLGVGKAFDINQLNTMATDPDREHVFTCDFSQLGTRVAERIKSKACKGGGGALLPGKGTPSKGTVRSAEYLITDRGIPRLRLSGGIAKSAEEGGIKVRWKPNDDGVTASEIPGSEGKRWKTDKGGSIGILSDGWKDVGQAIGGGVKDILAPSGGNDREEDIVKGRSVEDSVGEASDKGREGGHPREDETIGLRNSGLADGLQFFRGVDFGNRTVEEPTAQLRATPKGPVTSVGDTIIDGILLRSTKAPDTTNSLESADKLTKERTVGEPRAPLGATPKGVTSIEGTIIPGISLRSTKAPDTTDSLEKAGKWTREQNVTSAEEKKSIDGQTPGEEDVNTSEGSSSAVSRIAGEVRESIHRQSTQEQENKSNENQTFRKSQEGTGTSKSDLVQIKNISLDIAKIPVPIMVEGRDADTASDKEYARATAKHSRNGKPSTEYLQPVALFPLNAKYRARDVIGGNLPGELQNVIPATGPYNGSKNSLAFLGAPDSFIEFPNNGQLDTKNSMTLLAWILPETAGPIFNYMTDGWGVNLWMARPRKLFARFVDRENEKFTSAVKSTHIKPTKWNFVGATYDQLTGQAGLWINGKLEDKQYLGNISLATNYPVRMGARIGDKRYFRGRISCMQVFKVALGWREINAAKYKCRSHLKASFDRILGANTVWD